MESLIRLSPDQPISSLGPLDLLGEYWNENKAEDVEVLQKLAKEIIEEEK